MTALLERDDAVARLAELGRAALAGRGAVAVVVGRPGEGKTTLLAAAAGVGEQLGLRVHRAYSSALEQPLGFGVVRQLLTPAAADLAPEQLLTGPARMGASVLGLDQRPEPLDSLAALNGLQWLLAEIAKSRPTMLVVDDAHWSDELSLRWLASLRHRLDALPVLVVIASRPPAFAGAGDALVELLADPQLPLITVGPLSVEAVVALAERELVDPPGEPFAAACHRATGGNPLAVVELLRELRRAGVDASTVLESLGDRAPETISRHVRGRLDRLGPEAIAVAEALAVLGDRVQLRDVAALAGVDLDRAGEVRDELMLAGIVARSGELRFEHPLVHAAVRDTIGEGRRGTLHARAAALLSSAQGDPEAVAAHLMSAAPAGEAAAVRGLRLAAMAALRRGSPDSALVYLERALLEPPPAAQRGDLLRELGIAAWMVRGTDATARVEAAAELTVDGRERARLELIRAELAYFGGERERAFAALDRALAPLGSKDGELALRVRAMRATMITGFDCGWPAAEDRGYQELVAAAGAATRLGRELRMNLALVAVWRCRATGPEAVALVEGAVGPDLIECDEAGAISRVGHGLFALSWAGAPDRAAELTEVMMADATARGLSGKLGLAANAHMVAQHARGALAAAEASGRLALELTLRSGSRFADPVVRGTLGAVLTDRGQFDEARAMLTAVDPDPSMPNTCYLLRPALVALYRAVGDGDAARAQLEQLRDELPGDGWPNPAFVPWRSDMASLIAAEDPDRARRLASEELAAARRLELPRAIAVALRARALTESEGEREATLQESVAVLERDPARLELARSLIALGSELRRGGRRRDAREPLRRALDVASRCGAQPLMAVALEELQAADGRPRRPWLAGVDSLTPSELRVARLAANDASNQRIAETLFISIKTVEMHLTNAYRKLGTHSRAELPRLLEGESAAPEQ